MLSVRRPVPLHPQAGNVVQITIFLGICIGYISTYIFRVANKVGLLHDFRFEQDRAVLLHIQELVRLNKGCQTCSCNSTL